MEYILKTYNLTKIIKNKKILCDVNISIKKGDIHVLLGPNGSGKTTFIKLITNLLKPTFGEIELFKNKLTETSYDVFKKIGMLIDTPVFYEKLTPRENIELHCKYIGYYNHNSIDKILTLVNLNDMKNTPVKHLSLGMKQRLSIARAILTKPELLILDEPTNNLDPKWRKELLNLLKILNAEYGTTIIMASHILSEIEQIANTISIIEKGKIIKEVSMDSIQKDNFNYIEISVDSLCKAACLINEHFNKINFKVVGDDIIRIYDAKIPCCDISEMLVKNGIKISSIIKKGAKLEDYFLNVIEQYDSHK